MRNKYSCASIVPSSCVVYTGSKLAFLSDDEQPECDANLDDIIDKIGDAIDTIKQAVDVTNHVAACMTLSTPKTVKSVLQNHADKICALDASIQSLVTQWAAFDIANELITIDLGCLAPAAAPCQVGTNTYTLISILNLFRTEICAIKTHLGL
jgi:hypothetical protein